MEAYRPDTYGDAFADVYDDWYGDVSDTAATVAGVRDLLDGSRGPVLELGVGSGRLARPLAEAGVTVVGLDASAKMLDQLAGKPPVIGLHAVRADMSRVPFRTGFAGVLVAFNTLFNLPTQELQARCMTDIAAVLRPGGWLAVEAFVPTADPDAPSSGLDVRAVELDRVLFTVSRTDRTAQQVVGQHIEITSAGVRLRPWLVRYLYPDQLDDLARGAGLVAEYRWANWHGAPFDGDTGQHVSVYRRP